MLKLNIHFGYIFSWVHLFFLSEAKHLGDLESCWGGAMFFTMGHYLNTIATGGGSWVHEIHLL